MDVHNGEILALASAPRFDPAAFSGRRFRAPHGLACRSGKSALPSRDPDGPAAGRGFQNAHGGRPAGIGRARSGRDVPLPRLSRSARPAAVRDLRPPRHGPRRCHAWPTPWPKAATSISSTMPNRCRRTLWPIGRGGSVSGSRRASICRGEARGIVPSPETIEKLSGHRWHTADAQAMAIGQGALDGHAAASRSDDGGGGQRRAAGHTARACKQTPPSPSRQSHRAQFPALTYSSLAAIRAGLLRAVADKNGTAHDTLYLEQVSIAGHDGHGGNRRRSAGPCLVRRIRARRQAALRDGRRARVRGDASTAACPWRSSWCSKC